MGSAGKTIGIVGAGMMGRGIAVSTATAGLPTVLIKATQGDLEPIRAAIRGDLAKAVKRGHLDEESARRAAALISIGSERDALSGCDIVVESIAEDLDAKRALFFDIERRVRPEAVLATNSSTIQPSRIARALQRPERFVGLHFFSPVWAMKLVEIGATPDTAPFAMEAARSLVQAIGKTAVVVGDSAGYIVNRLLVPYLLDALCALEEGLAGPGEIDAAMKLGCGHPMGPLALSDLIGLDVVYAMSRTLHHEFHDRRYSPPALLRRLVLAHELGRKTGRGIYDYASDPPRPNPGLRLSLDEQGVPA